MGNAWRLAETLEACAAGSARHSRARSPEGRCGRSNGLCLSLSLSVSSVSRPRVFARGRGGCHQEASPGCEARGDGCRELGDDPVRAHLVPPSIGSMASFDWFPRLKCPRVDSMPPPGRRWNHRCFPPSARFRSPGARRLSFPPGNPSPRPSGAPVVRARRRTPRAKPPRCVPWPL